MSEEEKEAIKYLEFLSNEKCECEACQRAKKEYKTILNLIEKQQKEIEEKNIAINKMSKDISRQLEEIEEKSTIIMAGAKKVKQLEKEIQRLEKDNDTLSELVIVNEDKVIKELDLISKDKIREKLNYFEHSFDYDDDGTSYELVMEVLDELLEED